MDEAKKNNVADVDEEKDYIPKKKRKLHTYEKAKLAYERIKQEREEKRQLVAKRKQEREIALKKAKEMKKFKMKCLYKRTKRGQPKLSHQVEFLLKKIQNQNT